MTTNHPEKLDPALMRPGRADYHALINYASYNQMRRMYLKFNPGEDELATQFARSLPEKKIGMAKIQGLFLSYKNQPQKQIEMSYELLEDIKTDDEMTIIEWLNRMNCIKYANKFLEKKVFFMSDLRFYEEFAESF